MRPQWEVPQVPIHYQIAGVGAPWCCVAAPVRSVNMGADEAQGPGWWIASDGKWYPPALHPTRTAPPAPSVLVAEVDEAGSLIEDVLAGATAAAVDASSTQAQVLGEVRATAAGTSTERAVRSVPKWESDARDDIAAAIKRYGKPLADLVARDANEGDTRLFVTDFLCDALGFDKYEDLTTEYQVKGEFADYGIRLDKQLVAFIEVKRCTTKLGEKHLRQVQSYAVNEGVEWLVLTNGQVWQVWHLTGGLPVSMDLVIEVDLLASGMVAPKVAELFHLSKPAMKRQTISALWLTKKATSPASIARAILSPTVLDAIRKEVRRQTDHNASVAEIEAVIREGMLRADCL